jgi:hypothetical protein
MKTLLLISVVAVLAVVSYQPIAAAYHTSQVNKAQQVSTVKGLCARDVKTKWVKLEGALKVYKCSDFI